MGRLERALRFVGECRFGIVATVAVGMVLLAVFCWSPNAHEAGNSDGHYEWLYARSLVFDHDVDFKNDYALCGDPFRKGADPGTRHVDNPYYPGPAVIWTPALWVARHTVALPSGASERDREACTGPLVSRTLAVAPLLGALIVWLMYRAGRRFAGDGPSALGAAFLGLGTQLTAYAAVLTSYSHVHDAFWAALSLFLAIRASERPQSLARWALAGACIGIGTLQRPVSVVYGVIPGILALWSLRGQWRSLTSAVAVLAASAVAFGAVPLVLLYKYLYGAYYLTSPGHYRFFMQYRHAHPWLLLFAPHGGLFYSAPAAWIAVPGVFLGLRDRRSRPLLVALLIAAGAATWISAAALDWHGSGTFGARRITSVIPFMAVPAALTLERARQWMRARPSCALTAAGVAALVPVAFTIAGAAYAMTHGHIPTDYGSSQAGLYGEGERAAWGVVDDKLGDVSILPAELLFKLRYGLAMNAFRDATEPLYQRDFQTLGWQRNEIDFAGGQHANLTTGFESAKDGLHLSGRRGTIVFAAQWPYATRATLAIRAEHPATVRVGSALAFGRTDRWGELTADPVEGRKSVDIPSGSFESGIVAIAIECDDPSVGVVVHRLRIEDTTDWAHTAP